MPYEIIVRQMAPEMVAVARSVAARNEISNTIRGLMGNVWKFIKQNNVKSDGHMVAIYKGDPAVVPIEAGARVLEPFEGTADVLCSSTPGGLVAMTRLTGPYSKIGEAHAAIGAWCKANGKRGSTNWEVYGHWTEDETQLWTDIFYLIE